MRVINRRTFFDIVIILIGNLCKCYLCHSDKSRNHQILIRILEENAEIEKFLRGKSSET
jgi:hypothetical protein